MAIDRIKFPILVFALIAAARLLVSSAEADTANGYVVDHGIAIYYALIPAEMIKGHSKKHTESTMHGGIPAGSHTHHLTAALFNATTFERIVDADVAAEIGEVGHPANRKRLQPFTVAGALTYGNYFDFRARTEYRIRIDVKAPDLANPARVEFDFKHD